MCSVSSFSDEDTPNALKIQEILTKIFSFLPTFRRKNVRLTCSAWFAACNLPEILGTEKLLMHAKADQNDELLVFQTLMNSQRKWLNLEFVGFKFRDSSIPFWATCGDRILSLTFESCLFEKDIFKEILLECTRLQYLDINSIYAPHSMIPIFEQDTHDYEVVNENLVTLKLRDCRLVSDYTYNKIISIFPNIRELLFEKMYINCFKRIDDRYYRHLRNRDPLPDVDNIFNSQDIFSFTNVFNDLKLKASKIKQLSFHTIGDKGLTSEWLREIATLSNLNLTALSLKNHLLFSESSLIHLLSKQTELTKISLHKCANVTLNTVHAILKNCSKLESLDVHIYPIVVPNFLYEELFSLLLLAKLKTLHIVFETENYEHIENTMEVLKDTRNDYLRCFHCVKMSPNYVPFMVGVYRSLTSLTLIPGKMNPAEELTDADLQAVFSKLIYLRIFKVSIGHRISDFAFTGKMSCESLNASHEDIENLRCLPLPVSIRNLKKLENLEISERSKSCITSLTFNELVHLRLEALIVKFCCDSLESRGINSIPENIAELKYFYTVKGDYSD